ncbi:unnamed protein product [Ilex paraguariensis]|uniref:Uncharacterized protein n=1 Tax=Ilex paraguariensis TaxID=185542 RepID=A0ABC8SUS1_9AQUA
MDSDEPEPGQNRGSGKEEKAKKVGINLPNNNNHGNLITASNGDDLKNTFHQIRTSKTSVLKPFMHIYNPKHIHS